MFAHMLHAKRLHLLIPRPTTSITRDTMFCETPHTCFLNSCNSRARGFSAWNSHPIDAGGTGFLTNNVEPLLATPRWNPKPEQIEALEEMYKKGLRTPSAEQIQKIATKLRKYGKIEGKNVFYWFQNHKARERQKRRRRLMDVNNHPQLVEKHDNNIGTNMELKETGINVKVMDEPPKKSTYSTCGSISEDTVSKNITVKAESKTNVWAQTRIKKTTIQMDMSPLLPNYYIFSTTITTQQSSKQPCNDDKIEEKIAIRNNQILQLFPLGIINQSDNSSPKEEEESGMVIANNMALTPRQFFEFLPLQS